MKIPNIYRQYKILDESIDLSEEQEKAILQQFLTYLDQKNDKDQIETIIVRILNILFSRNRFRLQLIDRSDPQYNDLSRAYGYYSAYENIIYLIMDKSNFTNEKYTKLNNRDLTLFIETCIHELIHYTCTNYYLGFIKIWDSIFRQHTYHIFSNVVNLYFNDFIDNDTLVDSNDKVITPDSFLKNINFNKAYYSYYNSLLINIRFRYKSLIKRYNDVLSTLYSKQDFIYARFFDNVLINTIKLQNGDFSDTSIKLYRCIQKAYIDMEPKLLNEMNHELFYQELLDFSEIACVFSNHYKVSTKFEKLIAETLKLI